MSNLITVAEAAKILGVVHSRVRQLLNRGEIKGVKTPTSSMYRGEWKINKDSLNEYLATRRKPGRPRTK